MLYYFPHDSSSPSPILKRYVICKWVKKKFVAFWNSLTAVKHLDWCMVITVGGAVVHFYIAWLQRIRSILFGSAYRFICYLIYTVETNTKLIRNIKTLLKTVHPQLDILSFMISWAFQTVHISHYEKMYKNYSLVDLCHCDKDIEKISINHLLLIVWIKNSFCMAFSTPLFNSVWMESVSQSGLCMNSHKILYF